MIIKIMDMNGIQTIAMVTKLHVIHIKENWTTSSKLYDTQSAIVTIVVVILIVVDYLYK
jgi:hypothetical protein